MITAKGFCCTGGVMTIQKLENCPKCKGHLIIEKDNYGLYQQCLQCGYIHDLQIFPMIKDEEIKKEKESPVSDRGSAKGLRTISRDTAQQLVFTRNMCLTDPVDFKLILDALHKRHRD
jgi:DNA-directed RNA polymerase subunit M/transcription elongation factor TFIIS